MADGNGPSEKGGIIYAYAPGGRVRNVPFHGNLNLAAKNERYALVPYRSARFSFTASRSGAGPYYLTVAQGDINVMNVGQGGTYSATNGGMTSGDGGVSDAESMAGKQGGLCRNGATFITVGAQLVRERAWYTPAASAANQVGVRQRPAWISDNGPCGFDYGEELAQLVELAAFYRFQLFGGPRQVVEERQGSLSDWMSRGNEFNQPGGFIALASEFGSGGETTANMLQAVVTLGASSASALQRTIQVEERLGLTLPADGAVVLPYTIRLWGYNVCGNPIGDDLCAVPGADAAQLQQSLQMFTAFQQLLGGGEDAKAKLAQLMQLLQQAK